MGTMLKERKKMLRIPNQVVLPFGYRISVRQLSDAEMDKRDPNADGIWDDDTKTIYVRKRLPVTRRRYILAHELGHAWLDWQHRYMDDGKASI
ncbi:MAG: ImmA/IrrE family metallo-endopeptidase [Nitrospira sp.]|jgi:Zn-dependent peptidase ImmA (M78 family)|uniref:ImmA/IrrE family metallo-endopeptidase n=1 Tax=Nitrospira sp. BLG_1 TaxID=3395883 RepID=UPI0039BD6529|nr:ImmA/IrrE family metallo-endopeptidase [Nitrospira sp.]MBS0152158.1 ImmA/IrrE family metallo-endopeptidase [Nitrospira sp.]